MKGRIILEKSIWEISNARDINTALSVMLNEITQEMNKLLAPMSDTRRASTEASVEANVKTLIGEMDKLIGSTAVQGILGRADGDSERTSALSSIREKIAEIMQKVQPIESKIQAEIAASKTITLGRTLGDIEQGKGKFELKDKEAVQQEIADIERAQKFRSKVPGYATGTPARDEVDQISSALRSIDTFDGRLKTNFKEKDFRDEKLHDGLTITSVTRADGDAKMRDLLKAAFRRLSILKTTELDKKEINGKKVTEYDDAIVDAIPAADLYSVIEQLRAIDDLKDMTVFKTQAMAKQKEVAKNTIRAQVLVKEGMIDEATLMDAVDFEPNRRTVLSTAEFSKLRNMAARIDGLKTRTDDELETALKKAKKRAEGLQAIEDHRDHKDEFDLGIDGMSTIKVSGEDYSSADLSDPIKRIEAVNRVRNAIMGNDTTRNELRDKLVGASALRPEPKDASDYSRLRFIRRMIARRDHKRWEQEFTEKANGIIESKFEETVNARTDTANKGKEVSDFEARLKVSGVKGAVDRAVTGTAKTDEDLRREAEADAERD